MQGLGHWLSQNEPVGGDLAEGPPVSEFPHLVTFNSILKSSRSTLKDSVDYLIWRILSFLA